MCKSNVGVYKQNYQYSLTTLLHSQKYICSSDECTSLFLSSPNGTNLTKNSYLCNTFEQWNRFFLQIATSLNSRYNYFNKWHFTSIAKSLNWSEFNTNTNLVKKWVNLSVIPFLFIFLHVVGGSLWFNSLCWQFCFPLAGRWQSETISLKTLR